MDSKKLEYFGKKLILEKKRIYNLLDQMEKNETINSNSEMSSELSFYDNHPSDTATEIFDKERGMALKENEVTIIKKIDDALENVSRGTYGKCSMCGNDIKEERLEFIPYAEYCVECQKHINSLKPEERKNRAVEEDVLGYPFGYGYNDHTESIGFDAEDSYQAVGKFNRLNNVVEEYMDQDDEYVEPIEKISNEQYKNQLP